MRAFIVPAFMLATISSAFASRWDTANDPNKFSNVTGKPFTAKFSSLPLKAKLSNPHYIWSDTFWAASLGGVAYRWNNEPNSENFKYKMLSKTEIEKTDLADLEKLSATEKYDIYMGNYNYPLTKKVLSQNKPKDLWWEGICHGWSIAAVNHPEPARVNLINKDGITVPFGSTDVKGLLDYYYAEVFKSNVYARISERCSVDGKVPGEALPQDRVQSPPMASIANSPECAGVNPGSFHLALTNMIGLQDRGFVADVDRYNDVWNQPVGEYSAQIMEDRVANAQEVIKGIAKIVRVKMDMTYGEELNLLRPEDADKEGGFLSMDPVTTTPAQTFSTRNYEYTLEIDSSGSVIGGEWISETRPDFLWVKEKAKTFTGKLSGLNMIYRPFVN